jgi:YggT family protein
MSGKRCGVSTIITLIHIITTGLTLLVFADILVSYILSPYHPVRQSLDMVVQPLLAPIRRILPPTGPLDFSPLVLIIIIQLLDSILVSLLV